MTVKFLLWSLENELEGKLADIDNHDKLRNYFIKIGDVNTAAYHENRSHSLNRDVIRLRTSIEVIKERVA